MVCLPAEQIEKIVVVVCESERELLRGFASSWLHFSSILDVVVVFLDS